MLSKSFKVATTSLSIYYNKSACIMLLCELFLFIQMVNHIAKGNTLHVEMWYTKSKKIIVTSGFLKFFVWVCACV